MPSSDAVDIAAAQICTGGCRKYLNDYINYLAVCQVVAKVSDICNVLVKYTIQKQATPFLQFCMEFTSCCILNTLNPAKN